MSSNLMNIISMIREGDFRMLLVYILAMALAMFIAVGAHESAHGFVAYKLGDPTAKNMGRISLDPTKHFTLIGALCFFIFGIGWANPVLINPRNLKNYRRDDILIALAGPFTNLILAFIFYGPYYYVFKYTDNYVLNEVFGYLMTVNMSFAIFNLIPIPPLDGFHVISSLFIRKGYKVVDFIRRYSFIILLVLLYTGVIERIFAFFYVIFIPLFKAFYGLFL
ncbi:MAG: site-2 protease family protein [Christensenellaceae bacterium]|nr:site-2 protease family protein [Christensenellaceae bacterium]